MALISDSVLVDIAVALATCLVALYLYFTNAFRYWKRRGVPDAQPTFFFGNIGEAVLRRAHLGECLKKVYDNNPDKPVVGLYAMKSPFLMVRDLDILRRIIIKDAHAFLDHSAEPSETADPLFSRTLFFLKGKKWRHMRMKLTPTFTSGKIKKMFYLINKCGRQLLPCIEQEMSKGKGVAVKDTVARYSTDVIASCAFGVNANALADPNCEFRTATRKISEPTVTQRLIFSVLTFMPKLAQLFRLETFDNSINNFFRKIFWDIAEYRKTNGIVRNDFVDLILQIKDDGVRLEDANDLQEIKQDTKYMTMEDNKSGKLEMKLEDDDFVAQAFIFIAAGFDTSSSVISFTLFELAFNPRVQDKLRREMLDILAKHNSEVTYDAIAEMAYLDMVVSETLRKYPTVPVLDRKCLSDYRIPDTGITIEKGTNVMIPVLAIHMDPAIYPEPEKFDPERFSYENKNKRSNMAHIPFGEGPRICIGMRFGLLQVKTALVHILTTYLINTCAETPQPPLGIKGPLGVNTPKKDIVLAFEKIK